MNKRIKNKIKSSLLLLTLLFTCSITVFAGVGGTGDTPIGNHTGTAIYTFSYGFNGNNEIHLTVNVTNSDKGVWSFGQNGGDPFNHTWTSPNDTVDIDCQNPRLGSPSLDAAVQAAIDQKGYNFTVAKVKTDLNNLGYTETNGIWKKGDKYLTFINLNDFGEPVQRHTLIYDLNGGTWPWYCGDVKNEVTIESTSDNNRTLYPEKPVRDGFTFKYWLFWQRTIFERKLYPGDPYTHNQNGGTVRAVAWWEDETNPNVKITATPNQWSNQSANITISVKDTSGSGVRRTELYRVEAGKQDKLLTAWELAPFNKETTQGTVDYFYTDNEAEGLYLYRAVVYDWKGNYFSREHKNSLGNWAEALSKAVLIDKTAPTGTITAKPVNAWTNNKGVLSIDFNDHSFANVKSGIKEVHWYRRECFNYGVYQYRAITEDHAGNKTTIDSENVHIDKVGPALTINENKLFSAFSVSQKRFLFIL